jgi:predicted acetyltransferase
MSLMDNSVMELVWPAHPYLAGYVDALERGWSPDNTRAEAGREELERISQNPTLFLTQQVDRDDAGPRITLPDGSSVPRLPGYRRCMWDGAFCGVIGFRWQPGTTDLPPHCLGHIGFAVVPWKRGRGYASRALAMLLPDAATEGLDYVELTTDLDNVASQAVIRANGGELVEQFQKPAVYGSATSLRFRIPLAAHLRANDRRS